LEGLDDALEIADFLLEFAGNEKVLGLEILDHTLELVHMALLAVSKGSLSCPVLLLALGRTVRPGLATGLFPYFGWLFKGICVVIVIVHVVVVAAAIAVVRAFVIDG